MAAFVTRLRHDQLYGLPISFSLIGVVSSKATSSVRLTGIRRKLEPMSVICATMITDVPGTGRLWDLDPVGVTG